jgi:hypothetical protein
MARLEGAPEPAALQTMRLASRLPFPPARSPISSPSNHPTPQKTKIPQSLDAPVSPHPDDTTPLGELLPDPSASDAAAAASDAAAAAGVARLLAQLPERQALVVRLRFGLDGEELSLREVGRVLKVRGRVERRARAVGAGCAGVMFSKGPAASKHSANYQHLQQLLALFRAPLTLQGCQIKALIPAVLPAQTTWLRC